MNGNCPYGGGYGYFSTFGYVGYGYGPNFYSTWRWYG